jgi:hypothetical protein
MGEARRRNPSRIGRQAVGGEIKGSAAEIYADIAAYLVENSTDRILLLGPVVWQPSDGASAKRWYFTVGGFDGREPWHDQLRGETCEMAEEMRTGVAFALVAHPPCVLIDCDDELEMAKRAEGLWPCAKITRIRQSIEAERQPASSA